MGTLFMWIHYMNVPHTLSSDGTVATMQIKNFNSCIPALKLKIMYAD